MHNRAAAKDSELFMTDAEMRRTDPLYARELELEELMLSKGKDRFTTQLAKARKRGNVSHLTPYRRLTEELLVPMTAALAGWIETEQSAKRVRKKALRYLMQIPASTAILIGLRTILDRTGWASDAGHAPFLLTAAKSIGSQCEKEARMVAWEKAKPNIWYAVQRQLTEDKATAVHRARVNNNRFNKKVRDEIGWIDWPEDDQKMVGLEVIRIICETSGGKIKVIPDPLFHRTAAKQSPPWIIQLDPDVTQWLLHGLDVEERHNAVFMPTVMKPAPWTGMYDGGYLCGILPGRSLIRFKADNEEQARVAIGSMDGVDMPRVYDGVNTLQEAPWKINRRVYEVARYVWDKDLAIGGFPSKRLKEKPFRPAECDTDEQADREWRSKAAEVAKLNATIGSRIKKWDNTLEIAAVYVEEPRFYFPHALDFRGRAYPIPADLQPQGEDLARGLLTGADEMAKPVGENGAYWLAVHVANTWGNDKVNFDKRVQWVTKNHAMLMKVAEDPIKNKQWAKCSDAWQALAATFEWARYIAEGVGMLSSLPIRVDGTCNGIQHLSAMVRDEVGGASVNLVPGENPRDIYREVGGMLQRLLEELLVDGNNDDRVLAGYWLEAVRGNIPRELTKRPVMILPYGGTQQAYQKYINDWCDEMEAEHPGLFGDRRSSKRFKLVQWLTPLMWNTVELKLPMARKVQKWLQQCARLAASTGLPLRWVTPIGFVCRHFYGKRVGMTIETMIDGQRVQLKDWRMTKDMDIEDQMKGIPPNFVHSHDASVMLSSVNKAWGAGIDFITTIHDAFGTVAADVELLNACLREAFVEHYRRPILEEFRQHCAEILDDEIDLVMALPAVPKMGSLDIEAIKRSDYFFA